MSQRYIGSSISPTAAPTTSTSTTGVWSINDQYQAKNVNNWPMYVPPVTGDPYFPYVSMLLPGNGTNGAQNNTFLDSSTNNFTITRNGNTTQGTASPYYDCWSNYFDGSGDYLSTPDNAAFDLASNSFTFECWVYPTTITSGNNNILAQWGSGNAFIFRYVAAGRPQFSGAGTNVTGTTTAVIANQWNHLAITRSGTTVRLFVNGVMDATTGTIGALTNGASQVTIGAYSDGTSEYVTGYISNLRLVNGTAIYTATFTPPTTPLTAITNTVLLTCQSNRFIDNSANNFAITKNGDTSVQKFSPFSPAAPYSDTTNCGSAYFDGSGDYLSVPDNAAFDFTGDFTMEAWVYPLSYGTDNAIACQWTSGLSFIFKVVSGNRLYFAGYPGGTVVFQGSSTTVLLNQWNHVAITRSGTTARLFVNGVLDATTATMSGTLAGTDPITIGSLATSQYWNGYISNFRILKGTALYTTSFSPPTTPLTAITNTSLLVNGTNAGIIDNSEINVLETVNQVQISTTESKFGGSSIYFDGSGDYLKIPTNQVFAFGTGDFTVELWVYVINLSSIRQFYESYSGDSTGRLLMVVETNGNVKVQGQSGSVKTSGGTVATNTWTHIAVTRASGSMRIFVNGTQVNTTYSDSSTYTCTEPVKLGINGYDTSSYPFYGYMDDYRITKGYARYTTNFTAPTAAFPTS